jgi:hypothetical protein
MLNMLPKFELVPMMMYFMMLAKQQRRSVVDAVTHVPDDVPPGLESQDDPVLLLRRHAREDDSVLGLVGEGGVVHGVDVAVGDDVVGRQPDVVCDLPGYVLVVAGHDDHRDAVLFQRLEHGEDPSLGGSPLITKGEVESVFSVCRTVDVDGSPQPFDDNGGRRPRPSGVDEARC